MPKLRGRWVIAKLQNADKVFSTRYGKGANETGAAANAVAIIEKWSKTSGGKETLAKALAAGAEWTYETWKPKPPKFKVGALVRSKYGSLVYVRATAEDPTTEGCFHSGAEELVPGFAAVFWKREEDYELARKDKAA